MIINIKVQKCTLAIFILPFLHATCRALRPNCEDSHYNLHLVSCQVLLTQLYSHCLSRKHPDHRGRSRTGSKHNYEVATKKIYNRLDIPSHILQNLAHKQREIKFYRPGLDDYFIRFLKLSGITIN